MNRTLKIAVILLFIPSLIWSQKNNGNWQIQPYTNNIVKVIFNKNEYNKNYNITNATILKPNTTLKAKYSVQENGALILNYSKEFIIYSVNDEKGNVGIQWALQKDEEIYGGGERALPLNRRGYRLNLYNNPWYGYGVGADNLNYSVPFFLSNKGYAVFFDNGSSGYADIAKTDSNFFAAAFSGGEINMFIITGKTNQEILSSYHKLTGTQPLPPRWALGNLMSRFGYTSQTQVTEIAAKMKAEKIPVDGIIFDLFWFGDSIKGYMGNLDWVNKKAWPNPQQMIADFKKQNITTTLITEPYVLEYTNAYSESLDYWAKDGADGVYTLQDFYFGKGGLIDIFKKSSGNWIWNYHYKKQIKNGVTGWWTDLGEPERHPIDMYHDLKEFGLNKPVRSNEVHNIYGHYWNKMLFENYAKDYPTQRLFHLNRSGFAGSQRYSIFPWSGDVARNWSGLKAQPLVMLGMSVCGVPYVHADAGGFAQGEQDEELFIRWLQFATYTPIFRPHGTALYDVDPGAPSFPSEAALYDEPYKSLAKQAIMERYKLLPYIYTLAYKQTKWGEPIVKPLLFNYIKDTNATKQNNEYLFGDNILVAPVLDKGAETNQVYLPEGNWFEKNTLKIFKGNNFENIDVKDYKQTIFYKEGSFIPTYNCSGENTKEIDRSQLNILYLPSDKKSNYELYDDDGETKNAIQNNLFELIQFSSTGTTAKGFSINIKSNNGKYQGKPTERKISFKIPNQTQAIKQVVVNNTSIKDFTTANGILEFNVTLKSIPLKIDVKY